MKSKLLPTLLIILILLNGVLIFMLIKKPHEIEKHNSGKNFLTEQLNFSESQKELFNNLDEVHREKMLKLDLEIRRKKDVLFNSFNDESIQVDSLIIAASALEVDKELEVYHFFKSVRKICNIEQQKKFDIIINEALKGGQSSPPPRKGKNHPPREGVMPPPR